MKYERIQSDARKGFALLIAVVVSTIILTIGISIVNTAIQEVILASTVRNSLSSFYVGDGGAECALYWDNIRGNFDKKSAFAPGSPQTTIECNGSKSSPLPGIHSEFWIKDPMNINSPCSHVDIYSDASADPKEEKVRIDAWGFNTCDAASTRRVDRAIEVKYSRFK